MKALADILVGVVVRELKTQKPDDESGFCRNVANAKKDYNTDEFTTRR